MENIKVMSEQVSDSALKSVASELNQILKLEPQIDVENLKGDLLLSAITVAAQLVWETDALSEQTRKILSQITNNSVTEREVENGGGFNNEQSVRNISTESEPVSQQTEESPAKETEQEESNIQKDVKKTPSDPDVQQYLISLLKEEKYQKKEIVDALVDKFGVNKSTLSVFLNKCYKKSSSKLKGGYIGKKGKVLYFIEIN